MVPALSLNIEHFTLEEQTCCFMSQSTLYASGGVFSAIVSYLMFNIDVVYISELPCQWFTQNALCLQCLNRWSCEQKWVQMCWQVNPPETNESAPCGEARCGNTPGKSCDLSPWFSFVVMRSRHNNELPCSFNLWIFTAEWRCTEILRETPLHNPLVATDDLQQRYVCEHNSCADRRPLGM